MRHRDEDRDRRVRWLPRRMGAELHRHERLLREYAAGPAVELSRLPGGAASDGGGSGVVARTDGDVVGVLALATADDPLALLAAARRAVGDGGRLLLLEPYRRPGGWGRMSDATAPVVRALTGLRPDVEVPRLVRQAGFVIGTVERFSMPTLIAPLRSFCVVVAHPAAVVDGTRP